MIVRKKDEILASWLPRGHTLITTAVLAIIFASIGATAMRWLYEEQAQKNARDSRFIAAKLRCSEYWSMHSGEADAEYRYKKGEYALLEAVVHDAFSIDYGLPGVIEGKGKGIAVDRRFPLPGPTFGDLKLTPEQFRRVCRLRHLGYAEAYNITMLRLLGRSQDAFPLRASPEVTGANIRSASDADLPEHSLP